MSGLRPGLVNASAFSSVAVTTNFSGATVAARGVPSAHLPTVFRGRLAAGRAARAVHVPLRMSRTGRDHYVMADLMTTADRRLWGSRDRTVAAGAAIGHLILAAARRELPNSERMLRSAAGWMSSGVEANGVDKLGDDEALASLTDILSESPEDVRTTGVYAVTDNYGEPQDYYAQYDVVFRGGRRQRTIRVFAELPTSLPLPDDVDIVGAGRAFYDDVSAWTMGAFGRFFERRALSTMGHPIMGRDAEQARDIFVMRYQSPESVPFYYASARKTVGAVL